MLLKTLHMGNGWVTQPNPVYVQLGLSPIWDVSPDLIGKDRMDAWQAMWRPCRYSGHVACLEGRTVSGIKAGTGDRTGGLWVWIR